MPVFARFHGGHGGYGGRPLHWSDFVSTENGQPHYHLIPLIGLATVIFLVLLFIWLSLTAPSGANTTISNRTFVIAGVVILLIAAACWILVQYPQFSLF